MKKIYLVLIMLVFSNTVSAQSVDDLLESAREKDLQENIQGAIDDYTRALQIEPKNHGAYFERGKIYKTNAEGDSDYQKAQADLKKAIEYQPVDLSFDDKVELYTEYRNVTYELQGYDVKDDLITQLDEIKNSRIKELTVQLSNKLEVYEQIDIYKERADIFNGMAQYEKAIENGLKLVELTADEPDESARWKLYIAEIYDESLESPSAALPFYNQAIPVLLPNATSDDTLLGNALLHRAVILSNQGQVKQACEDYRKGQKMVPNYWLYIEIEHCKALKNP
jgi:tetratricopeptide (TPR) repeat protein